MTKDELQNAVDVLIQESNSIKIAALRLEENFSKAVDILFSNKNKIIVCGIGKSGLLGKK